MKPEVEVVRVYEDPGRRSGDYRVLVDRLWPRGVSKVSLDLDDWTKQLAPSSGLRTWYGHDPDRFTEFSKRYRRELENPDTVLPLRELNDPGRGKRIVLLTATRDVEHSGARVLRDFLIDPKTRTIFR